MEEKNYKQLGQRIRKVRLLRQLTQEALAAQCKMAPSFVGIIERADKKPSISTLVEISNALNVSIDYLLFDSLTISTDRIYSINNDTPQNATRSPQEIASILKILEHLTSKL